MHRLALPSLFMLLSSQAALAQPAPEAAPTAQAGTILVEQDTPIRLMVLNEVTSRRAKPGDRFVLRVDEPVVIRGATVIPVGAKAWGEVVAADRSGAVGKGGELSARLVSVEIGGGQVPISGDLRSGGAKGTTQVAMGMLGLGPLALLAPGNNAKLKAGDLFTAYLQGDMLFDPATSKLAPVPVQPMQIGVTQ